jgi:acetolactate synthase I/III small subunit
MRYILSLTVENKHGVLAKIAQVITGRGYNICTLSVAPSINIETSNMIITFDCEEKIIEQVVKQLNKLIDVIKVFLIDNSEKVERELLLLKIARKKDNDLHIESLVKIYRGRIVDTTLKSFTVELTGHSKKIDTFIENARPFGLQEMLRTGPLALPRGEVKAEK